jgi:hypothetical protein
MVLALAVTDFAEFWQVKKLRFLALVFALKNQN